MPERARRRAAATDPAASAGEVAPEDTTYCEFNRARVDEKQWTGCLKKLEFKRRSGELIERTEDRPRGRRGALDRGDEAPGRPRPL